ncbi:uncharacterized protein JCM6883_002388, partial [Sporobolomyces salmoneus]|uniref:uncharacterized protein n=1 Tax=Sporobolomyces salmoneus TaxID=183962 RepID=UPI0031773C50
MGVGRLWSSILEEGGAQLSNSLALMLWQIRKRNSESEPNPPPDTYHFIDEVSPYFFVVKQQLLSNAAHRQLSPTEFNKLLQLRVELAIGAVMKAREEQAPGSYHSWLID